MLLTENKLRLIIKEEFDKLLNEGEVVSGDFSSAAKEQKKKRDKFFNSLEQIKIFTHDIAAEWAIKYKTYTSDIQSRSKKSSGGLVAGYIGKPAAQQISKEFHDELAEVLKNKIIAEQETNPASIFILAQSLSDNPEITFGQKIPEGFFDSLSKQFIEGWHVKDTQLPLDYFKWYRELCVFFLLKNGLAGFGKRPPYKPKATKTNLTLVPSMDN